MKTVDFCDKMFKNLPCVLTIGVFDGVHLGHKKILEECVKTAFQLNCKSVVCTFNVNPKMFIGSEEFTKPIISNQEKNNLFAELALDYHCVIDFSSYMSKLSGEEFIAKLCTSYNLKAMVVGQDFKCGNSTSCADVTAIGQMLVRYTSSAFLKVVPSVYLDGQIVSSSLIRRCLLTGDFDKASKLLGRTYILR